MTINFDVFAMDNGNTEENESSYCLLGMKIPNKADFIRWRTEVTKTAAYKALVIGIGVAGAAFLLRAIWEAATTSCKENCEENSFCKMVNSLNYTLESTGQYVYKLICAYIPYLCQTAVEHITKNRDSNRNCQLIIDPVTFTARYGEGCEHCTQVCNSYCITPKTDVLRCEGHCS